MSKKDFETLERETKNEMIAAGDFTTERDAILEAIRESIDKDIWVKVRKETPPEEKIKVSFSVTVDPEDKTVQAVMSASLKLKQEGWSDWSGATGELFEWQEKESAKREKGQVQ